VEQGGVATGALAEEGDLLGVTAEVGDVVLDPLDGEDLVLEADVGAASLGELREVEETERVQAVLYYSHDEPSRS
jgi:hypothetical protein